MGGEEKCEAGNSLRDGEFAMQMIHDSSNSKMEAFHRKAVAGQWQRCL
jgi:hypothetical protein